MTIATNQLLWVDDDSKARFRYERRILERAGWQVLWAEDIDSARVLLAHERFGALILDQSLPFRIRDTPTGIEGGYLLLHWLRKGALPEQFDLPQQEPALEVPPPLKENMNLPVIFISAFYDEALSSRIRELSQLDRTIEIIPKPIDHAALIRFLDQRDWQ